MGESYDHQGQAIKSRDAKGTREVRLEEDLSPVKERSPPPPALAQAASSMPDSRKALVFWHLCKPVVWRCDHPRGLGEKEAQSLCHLSFSRDPSWAVHLRKLLKAQR